MNEANETVPRAQKEIKLTPADEARFWAKVDKSGGADACWLWMAGRNSDGYGLFTSKKRHLKAHRVAWTLANGQIPHDGSYHGICACHNCPGGDRPECVNPAHLFLGTHKENHHDKERKGRGNQASGDKNGSRTLPERLARGDRNGSRLYPERRPRGEANYCAILTESQVLEIRARYAAGGIFQKDLAKNFGVGVSTVGHIVTRRKWKHVLPQRASPGERRHLGETLAGQAPSALP